MLEHFKRIISRLVTKARSAVPTHEQLGQIPILRPIAHRLAEPDLWKPRFESVARGVAIGVFWAFIIPLAQIIIAAVHCVYQRGNIPASVLSTMITNPLNFPFWWWLAYHIGNWFIGNNGTYSSPPSDASWFEWALSIGKPTFLGMAMMGVVFSIVSYFGVKLVWRTMVSIKRRKRLRQAISKLQSMNDKLYENKTSNIDGQSQ